MQLPEYANVMEIEKAIETQRGLIALKELEVDAAYAKLSAIQQMCIHEANDNGGPCLTCGYRNKKKK